MITARTMKHGVKRRTLASFRPCRTVNKTRKNVLLDQGRTVLNYARLLTNGARRKWRNGLWQLRR